MGTNGDTSLLLHREIIAGITISALNTPYSRRNK
jgi:hypothetical protein